VPGPLQGLRILDASRVLTGPFCSMILGDLGPRLSRLNGQVLEMTLESGGFRSLVPRVRISYQSIGTRRA
jgi:hypothetical protein